MGKKYSYDEALDRTSFGRYNVMMLVSCCLLILTMYTDIFGFSVVLPATACDMELDTSQQGVLSAMPLIGVMISSYAWGLCADTLGRKTTLMMAMPVGVFLNVAASFAPTFTSLAALKFLSASFTSSANAAAFVLMGESVPARHRSRFMFFMASVTMFVQLFICMFALPVFQLSFHMTVSWLPLDYRPWRLLLLIISTPGLFGIAILTVLQESPKYLLSVGKEDDAIEALKTMYFCNTGLHKETFAVTAVFLEETSALETAHVGFLRKMWNQTAPLFQPPLLKNSLKLYYLLLCAYMTSTGYTMWIPTMTNSYFDGEDKAGLAFCEVASQAATSNTSASSDCDNVVQPLTLYAVICQSGAAGALTVLLSFLVKPMGKKQLTIMVFIISATCGVALLLVRIPMLSLILFYVFLYVSLILGNINSYIVELNPTHLRGMATCLSVVVARGFGFGSVQLIATLLADHCTPMIAGYVALVMSGLVVSFFLPAENTKQKAPEPLPKEESTWIVEQIEYNGIQRTRF